MALDIAKERVAMRMKAQKNGKFTRCRRQKPDELPESAVSQ
jgi:hypothetical protein